MGSSAGKRATDLGLGIPMFVLTLPLQLAVACLIRIRLGRPVLFRQVRPGLGGKPFEIVKFRTLLLPEQVGNVAADSARMTPFGAALRATSLDELPSLWNVVRGDMSLVGPRPLLMEYLDRFTPDQARRHEVRPGLTGLAQVRGRNSLSWEDKFALDVRYVDSHTLAMDLRILVASVGAVVRRTGITSEGHVTAREFTGSSASTTIEPVIPR